MNTNCRFNLTIKFSTEKRLKDFTSLEEKSSNDITTTTTTTIVNLPTFYSCFTKTINTLNNNTTTKDNLINEVILVFIKNYRFKTVILTEELNSHLMNQIKDYSLVNDLFTFDEIKNLFIKMTQSYENNHNLTNSNCDTSTSRNNTNNTNFFIEYNIFSCYGLTFTFEEKHIECFLPHWNNDDIKKLISTVNLLNENFTIPDSYSSSTNINSYTINISIYLLLIIPPQSSSKKNITSDTTTTKEKQVNNLSNDNLCNLYKETYEVSMIYPFKKNKTITLVRTINHIEKFSNFNQFRRALYSLMKHSN